MHEDDEFTTSASFASPAPDSIVFRASGPDNQVLLTVTADGRILVGPGLSMDDATQQAAAMLATHFYNAVSVPAIPPGLAETTAQLNYQRNRADKAEEALAAALARNRTAH